MSWGLGGSDANGGVKVVGLGTDHRLSLAQNPAVRGNVARPLATCIRRPIVPHFPEEAKYLPDYATQRVLRWLLTLEAPLSSP